MAFTFSKNKGTMFVALPRSLRRDIDGGCVCNFCKAHPNEKPQWDTLAVDSTAPDIGKAWPVHYPEVAYGRD